MGAPGWRTDTQVRPCKNDRLDLVKQPWEPSLNPGSKVRGRQRTYAVPLFMVNSKLILIRMLHQERET